MCQHLGDLHNSVNKYFPNAEYKMVHDGKRSIQNARVTNRSYIRENKKTTEHWKD